jgi:hypothetical protein
MAQVAKRGGFMSRVIVPLLALAVVNPAIASGTIAYGSRAGMEVTVVSMEGLDTAHAVIRTKHTRENAIAFSETTSKR